MIDIAQSKGRNSFKHYPLLVTALFLGISGGLVVYNRQRLASLSRSISTYRETTLQSNAQPHMTFNPSPSPTLTPTRVPSPIQPPTQRPKDPQDAWGVASKVDDVTYSIKVGYDATMGTPQEILAALNVYRQSKGVSTLNWNDRLGIYAQSRADYFTSAGSTDKHAGFNSFLNENDGFQVLRFNKVGENSYFGGPLTGTHVIEWVFSQSPGHDANQLNPEWTHVGIGVSKDAINLIFGAREF